MLLFFCSLNYTFANDGGDKRPTGARSAGMGNASVTLSDQWAFYNNAAGLASLQNSYATSTFQHSFGLRALNVMGASFIMPLSTGVSAMGIHKFGDEYFNVQNLSLGYGHKIDQVSLGMKINCLQLSIDQFGSRRFFVAELGGISELLPNLTMGAHIYNINRAKISEHEAIPTVMKLGITYFPHEKLLLTIETKKDIDYKAMFKAGIEYKFHECFVARTGFTTEPYVNYFGIGINRKNLSIDYATGINYSLGAIYQLSLSWKFVKDES
ncbi:MAG: hypothetical protein ACK4ND_17325 [Cytophagaceae bacterium]